MAEKKFVVAHRNKLEETEEVRSKGLLKLYFWFFTKSIKVIMNEGLKQFARKALLVSNQEKNKMFSKIIPPNMKTKRINDFKKLYHLFNPRAYWCGIPVIKNPLDLWIYQEIINNTRPDFIIETGTHMGGSALFFASICDFVGRGKVITIDIRKKPTPRHPRIIRIIGSSISDSVVKKIEQIVDKKRVMVSLDSDHDKDYVLKELELYSKFVSVGSYIVVEDVTPEVVEEFLHKRKDFVADRTQEKFLLTSFPKSFLKRVSW